MPTNQPLDFTKPVCTKGMKHPVRILCLDGPEPQPVVGIILDPEGEQFVTSWTIDGRFRHGAQPGGLDLEQSTTRTITGWVNITSDGGDDFDAGLVYLTRELAEDARRRHPGDYCTTIQITWSMPA